MSKHVFITHFFVEFEALAALLPNTKGFVQIRTQKFFIQFSLIVVISRKVCNFLQQLVYDVECLSEVVINEKPWMS